MDILGIDIESTATITGIGNGTFDYIESGGSYITRRCIKSTSGRLVVAVGSQSYPPSGGASTGVNLAVRVSLSMRRIA